MTGSRWMYGVIASFALYQRRSISLVKCWANYGELISAVSVIIRFSYTCGRS